MVHSAGKAKLKTTMYGPVRLVVTDLDNTLYDWLTSFVPAFYSMIEVAANILNVSSDQLLEEMKVVHQRYHNSEQPYALLEATTVLQNFPHTTALERKQRLAQAFNAFNSVRKNNLQLYPGVLRTLDKIRQTGCIVVGHTEAVVENSLYRAELLGLTELLTCLYAPESKAPHHPDPQRPRIQDAYGGFVYLLPSNHRKPDPSVLKDICRRHGVSTHETVYVGDSIPKDVAMAKSAGALAVWARYGSQRDDLLWEKLVRVTHWTSEDVAHEVRLREETKHITPDVVIDSFDQLLQIFKFAGGRVRSRKPPVAAIR